MGIAGITGYGTTAAGGFVSSGAGAVELPDCMTTKGQSKLSEGGIKEKLMALARREAAAGIPTKNLYRSESPEFRKLEEDYISFASPDRKGIINNTLSRLGQMLGRPALRGLSLLNAISRNFRLFGSRDIGDNCIFFRDAAGEYIATWDCTGWQKCETKTECARRREFDEMWREFRIEAGTEEGNADATIRRELSGGGADVGRYVKSCEAAGRTPKMNYAKLAAYGITYDAETGETHVDSAVFRQAARRYGMNMMTA